jgi:hypothetical protein
MTATATSVVNLSINAACFAALTPVHGDCPAFIRATLYSEVAHQERAS